MDIRSITSLDILTRRPRERERVRGSGPSVIKSAATEWSDSRLQTAARRLGVPSFSDAVDRRISAPIHEMPPILPYHPGTGHLPVPRRHATTLGVYTTAVRAGRHAIGSLPSTCPASSSLQNTSQIITTDRTLISLLPFASTMPWTLRPAVGAVRSTGQCQPQQRDDATSMFMPGREV